MTISDFYKTVRTYTRANSRDLPDEDIEILANPEADYLYELSIQGEHLEQTKNAIPTVYTFTMTDDFQETDHNLWIQRVEVSIDGGDTFYQIDRTNKTEYTKYQDICNASLTHQFIDSDTRPDYFIQTSQGIHVFPMADSVITKIYVKDTPLINWNSNSAEILLPNVPTNLLALKTALMYRDINDTNQIQFLQNEYKEKFAAFEKRIAKGGRVIQMRQRNKVIR